MHKNTITTYKNYLQKYPNVVAKAELQPLIATQATVALDSQ